MSEKTVLLCGRHMTAHPQPTNATAAMCMHILARPCKLSARGVAQVRADDPSIALIVSQSSRHASFYTSPLVTRQPILVANI